ncbi:HNH endonuclease [Maricurvus nonylphenolicus]|uniref:HNH endonuclease n=1 Tax=Maricurvus nonylphenolicus TaxID=1008307 RepID=UPI0036F35357
MSSELVVVSAAFEHVKQLDELYGDAIPSAVIEQGFNLNGETVLLMNRAAGIFKPRQMSSGVLSIKTTIPRKGAGINIYNDQLTDDGYYQYSLQKGDPRGGRNKCLWQAYESKQPFVYFHAIAPAVYKALWPCFIEDIHPDGGYAKILVGIAQQNDKNSIVEYKLPDAIESRYMVRETKVRLHQSSFRAAVLDVYKNRCAVTGMAQPRLIDAAHIVPDSQVYGKQLVNNGIALSNLHHRAFDRNLLGIDGDYRIHISSEIKEHLPNGFVDKAFLACDKQILNLPSCKDYYPNRESLAEKFERFRRK